MQSVFYRVIYIINTNWGTTENSSMPRKIGEGDRQKSENPEKIRIQFGPAQSGFLEKTKKHSAGSHQQ